MFFKTNKNSLLEEAQKIHERKIENEAIQTKRIKDLENNLHLSEVSLPCLEMYLLSFFKIFCNLEKNY
jgi:hypothetical protein